VRGRSLSSAPPRGDVTSRGRGVHDGRMADTERTAWFYNVSTGEVEHGPQSLGRSLMGPYDSREEATQALETARARTQAWDEEERARDS